VNLIPSLSSTNLQPGMTRSLPDAASPRNKIILIQCMKIRKKMIGSVSISALIVAILFFVLHLFGNWKLSDGITRLPHDNYFHRDADTSIVLVSPILDCNNQCLVFYQQHQAVVFDDLDKKGMDFVISRFKLSQSLDFRSDGHLLQMLLLTLIITSILYFFFLR
jgi:hypothetical protein